MLDMIAHPRENKARMKQQKSTRKAGILLLLGANLAAKPKRESP